HAVRAYVAAELRSRGSTPPPARVPHAREGHVARELVDAEPEANGALVLARGDRPVAERPEANRPVERVDARRELRVAAEDGAARPAVSAAALEDDSARALSLTSELGTPARASATRTSVSPSSPGASRAMRRPRNASTELIPRRATSTKSEAMFWPSTTRMCAPSSAARIAVE